MKKFWYAKIRIVFILAIICFFAACAAPKKHVLQNEQDFRDAFNKVYFHNQAKVEVPVKYGRIDLLTDDYAVEVDKLERFHEAMGQSLHYARETGRKPAIAIFIIDKKDDDEDKMKYVTKLCSYYGIKVWFINDELKKEYKIKHKK